MEYNNFERLARRFGVSLNNIDIDTEIENTINRINVKRLKSRN